MSTQTQYDELKVYEITVKGVLDEKWSEWFDGLRIVPQASGDTVMAGPVPDQAALYGLLNKIRDIGLPLVSVRLVVKNQLTLERESAVR